MTAGIEPRPKHIRRKAFSGPITGCWSCASAGPVLIAASASAQQRILKVKFPYEARITAVGWHARLDGGVTTASLRIETKATPNTSAGAEEALLATPVAPPNPITGLSVNLVTTPVGVAYFSRVNVTDLLIDPVPVGESVIVRAKGADIRPVFEAQSNEGFPTTKWVRSGLTGYAGAGNVELSIFVYHWPTEHIYTDKAND